MKYTKKNSSSKTSNQNDYDDDNIPEIDLPKKTNNTNASDVIPDDVPRHDGPGGE